MAILLARMLFFSHFSPLPRFTSDILTSFLIDNLPLPTFLPYATPLYPLLFDDQNG